MRHGCQPRISPCLGTPLQSTENSGVAVASPTGRCQAEPVRLGVVVDEDRRTVPVAVQAVQRQAEDVLRTPPGVDGDLDGGPDLCRLLGVHPSAQLVYDLGRQIASRLAARGSAGMSRSPTAKSLGSLAAACPGRVSQQVTDIGAVAGLMRVERDDGRQPTQPTFSLRCLSFPIWLVSSALPLPVGAPTAFAAVACGTRYAVDPELGTSSRSARATWTMTIRRR